MPSDAKTLRRRRCRIVRWFLFGILVTALGSLSLAYKAILDRALERSESQSRAEAMAAPENARAARLPVRNPGASPSEPSWNRNNDNNDNNTTCAILLFGLPRAFKEYVLPSLRKNVVAPNARHRCDYFVHYYKQDHEEAGRSGKGGTVHHEDVLLLRETVHSFYGSSNSNSSNDTARKAGSNNDKDGGDDGGDLPHVGFVSDTNRSFWEARTRQLVEYRTAKHPDGKYKYFPYAEPTYVYPGTIDNIVRQWHSIQAVWESMEDHASSVGAGVGVDIDKTKKKKKTYDVVAMVRNDVVFVTPIDLFEQSSPQKATIPGFARYPVNDRMICGPHDAVEIWATQRFARIEKHASLEEYRGMAMHSETFLNASLLPSIEALGIAIEEDPTLCFLRVRADGAIWIEDCDPSKSGPLGGGYPGGQKAYGKLLLPFLGQSNNESNKNNNKNDTSNDKNHKICRKRRVRDRLRRIIELYCREPSGRLGERPSERAGTSISNRPNYLGRLFQKH